MNEVNDRGELCSIRFHMGDSPSIVETYSPFYQTHHRYRLEVRQDPYSSYQDRVLIRCEVRVQVCRFCTTALLLPH